MIEREIFRIIKGIVLNEEEELAQIDKGIFFAPELSLAYQIGKAIYKDREKIFNLPGNRIQWARELNLDNGGPSDIVFEIEHESGDSTYYVIEIKLRDTIDSYQRDINKLKLLDFKHNKLFCALIDTFDKENDLRIKRFEDDNFGGLNRVDDFVIFKTKQDWYKKDVYCVLGLWTIKAEEGMV